MGRKNTCDHEETIRFLESLKMIKRRPAMYFGSNYGYQQLTAFIYGYLLGSKALEENSESTAEKIHQEVNHRIFVEHIDDNNKVDILEGKAVFDEYFEKLDAVLDEFYPEYCEKQM